MNRKFIVAVSTAALVLCASPAFAAGNAVAHSNASSSAAAIGAMGAPVANARGGNASAKGGQATSSLTATQTAQGGQGGQGVGSVSVKQNFAASKIPMQVPTVMAPAVPSPPIFGGLNAPTEVKGIPLTEWFVANCDTTATREHPLKDEHFHHQKYLFGGGMSISGDTDITFSPTQGYYFARQYPHYKGEIPYNAHPVLVDSVRIRTPQQVRGHKYKCLGLLQVRATKKDLPFSSVIADARIFPLGYMEGRKKVTLVLVPSAVAAALGVRTAGSSFSLVPSFVKMASSALTGGAAGASISGGEGATYASSQIGATFLVLSPSKGGQVFNIMSK